MGLIIDSNVLIRHEKTGRANFFTQHASYGEAYISAITVSELLTGVHLANTDARRAQRQAFVEGLLQFLPVLDFTAQTARIHAELYALLRKTGAMIGAHDLLIAATALQYGCALLTGNQKEFNRVPGLNVIAVTYQ